MTPNTRKVANKLKTLALVCAGGTLVFSGLCIYQGQEQYYEKILMPTTRLLPPETSHKLAVLACKYKLFAKPNKSDDKILNNNFFGKLISNPVGIAAGFDKQGEAVEGLTKIGFGFVEIGSVTPDPQPGNPLPRIFRLVQDEAIINRYGFNSEGHAEVFKRLKALRDSGNFNGILGINLGKNKTSPSAKEDYKRGVLIFGPIADYLVINVSSPNTPGLRELQGKKDLEALLETVIQTRNNLHVNNKVPVLLKLAPDLTDQDIKDIASVLKKKYCGVDGIIVSNTTIARDNIKEMSATALEKGGLSGVPLRQKSTKLIAKMFKETGGKIPIIGVGGISTGHDAFEKIEAGASYLQLYTSFIYHGPPVVTRIKSELADILKDRKFNSISEAVGSNYKSYLSK